MKLFNSVAYDAIYGKFVFIIILCIVLALIPSLFLVFVGIVSILVVFKTAIEIDEFNCRYSEIINDLDVADNVHLNDKTLKSDGVWL